MSDVRYGLIDDAQQLARDLERCNMREASALADEAARVIRELIAALKEAQTK